MVYSPAFSFSSGYPLVFCRVPGFALGCCASFKRFWPLALVQQAQAAIFFAVLRRLGGAVLFRSSCPSPNSGYPFWLLALTFRSSRPAFCGRLTSPVSPLIFPLYAGRYLFQRFACLKGFPSLFGLQRLPAKRHQLSFLQCCAASVAQRFFVGRSKDLIISGGYNVYPAEIEGYINDMPGVAESALVGVPHPDFGEVGVAVVIAKPGASLDADAIVAQLKSQLANFKIPKKCFVVAELPRNTMGKVQKNLLRDQYKGLFA